MGRPWSLPMHVFLLALEALLFLSLLDARHAFLCRWCLTPPVPPDPILPADFWHSVFGFMLPEWDTYCITSDLDGLVIVAGAALVAHAFYLVSGGRRTSQP